MTRLLVIRHAESVWNAEGRWQGHADPPLSERGRLNASAAAARLDGEVSRIVASDLVRARETAEIVGSALGLDVAIEPDLREVDVGEWSGLTSEEIEVRWPGGIAGWRAGTFVPPGAEDPEVFVERVRRALLRVASADERPALVVTHGGVVGRLEHRLGVHPGVPLPRLAGRWLLAAGDIEALGERIHL